MSKAFFGGDGEGVHVGRKKNTLKLCEWVKLFVWESISFHEDAFRMQFQSIFIHFIVSKYCVGYSMVYFFCF